MALPKLLPCRCMNPKCSIMFYAPNPVGGSGYNITFSGNMTTCPNCHGMAQYADWVTDEKGEFHLKGFFKRIRDIGDVNRLLHIESGLKSISSNIDASDIVDSLEKLDPIFHGVRYVLRSMPIESIYKFVNTVAQIITLVLMVYMFKVDTVNHKENVGLQLRQIEIATAQFNYQKERDAINDKNSALYLQDIVKIKERIDSLERAFEQEFEEDALRIGQPESTQHASRKGLKGSQRNKPCACGSGIKAKHCHPNGFFK